MLTYNLLEEPWILAEYCDGSMREIGIKNAFEDAEIIKQIHTPRFHSKTFCLYEYSVVKLLSTIVMAAYYKPATKFAAKNLQYTKPLMTQKIYNDVIKSYLNEFENRFDLFNEQHPFLQDVGLKEQMLEASKPDKKGNISNAYISLCSPMAPGLHNFVFGATRSAGAGKDSCIDGYRITPKELAYVLIYTASIGPTQSGVQYTKALSGSVTEFLLLTGKNLKETILLNCASLANSARPTPDEPDKPYDRPVWELKSLDELPMFFHAKLNQDLLMCSYFPAKRLLAKPELNNGEITYVFECNKKKLPNNMSCDLLKILYDSYVLYNFNCIRAVQKVEKQKRLGYATYTGEDGWLMCIAATKQLAEEQCNILSDHIDDDYSLKIYYRMFDTYKVAVDNSGICEIPYRVQALLNQENHERAEKFQKLYDDLREAYIHILVMMDTMYSVRGIRLNVFSAYIQKYFYEKFVPHINEPDVISNAAENLSEYVSKLFQDEINCCHDVIKFVKAEARLEDDLKDIVRRYSK